MTLLQTLSGSCELELHERPLITNQKLNQAIQRCVEPNPTERISLSDLKMIVHELFEELSIPFCPMRFD